VAALLLINPNTSARSLAMMLGIAAPLLPPGVALRGVSAARGVAMIVNEADLLAAAPDVVRLGLEARNITAIVVAAFGDPGAEALRDAVSVPVVGIGEASIAEAAEGGRRFGIATTTPGLVRPIEALVERLSLSRNFTGVRVAGDDPVALAADAARQQRALARSVHACIDLDGAEAVIIGGGPLSAAARSLRLQFVADVIEPVPAAIRHITRLLHARPVDANTSPAGSVTRFAKNPEAAG
jgi:Asp/Glu/hydantoin racemase